MAIIRTLRRWRNSLDSRLKNFHFNSASPSKDKLPNELNAGAIIQSPLVVTDFSSHPKTLQLSEQCRLALAELALTKLERALKNEADDSLLFQLAQIYEDEAARQAHYVKYEDGRTEVYPARELCEKAAVYYQCVPVFSPHYSEAKFRAAHLQYFSLSDANKALAQLAPLAAQKDKDAQLLDYVIREAIEEPTKVLTLADVQRWREYLAAPHDVQRPKALQDRNPLQKFFHYCQRKIRSFIMNDMSSSQSAISLSSLRHKIPTLGKIKESQQESSFLSELKQLIARTHRELGEFSESNKSRHAREPLWRIRQEEVQKLEECIRNSSKKIFSEAVVNAVISETSGSEGEKITAATSVDEQEKSREKGKEKLRDIEIYDDTLIFAECAEILANAKKNWFFKRYLNNFVTELERLVKSAYVHERNLHEKNPNADKQPFAYFNSGLCEYLVKKREQMLEEKIAAKRNQVQELAEEVQQLTNKIEKFENGEVVKEQAQKIEELEHQKRELEQRLVVKDEEIGQLREEMTQKLAAKDREIEWLQDKIKELQERIKELERLLAEKGEELRGFQESFKEKMEKQSAEISKKMSWEFNHQAEKMKQGFEHQAEKMKQGFEHQAGKMIEESTQKSKEIGQLQLQLSQQSEMLQLQVEKNKRTDQKLEEKDEQYRELKGKHDKFIADHDKINAKKDELIENVLRRLNDVEEKFSTQLAKTQKQLKNAEEKLEKIEEENTELKKILRAFHGKSQGSQKRAKSSYGRLFDAATTESTLSTEVLIIVPERLRCPITQQLMVDPVTLPEDGYTYERKAIEKWRKEKGTSPMNRAPLDKSIELLANITIRNDCREFREEREKQMERLLEIQEKQLNQEEKEQAAEQKKEEGNGISISDSISELGNLGRRIIDELPKIPNPLPKMGINRK